MNEIRYKDKEYLSGYDLDIELFRCFNLKVQDVVPVRKVYIASTDQGDVVLKKINCSINDLEFVNKVIEEIKQKGFKKLFSFIKTIDGKLYKEWNGNVYCVMTFIDGRECTYSNPLDLKLAIKTIGEFHKASFDIEVFNNSRNKIGKFIDRSYEKLNDLVFYKKLVNQYKHKNKFDEIFMENVNYYIEQIRRSIDILEKSDYYDICGENGVCSLCHHDLAYHNVLIKDNEAHFVDFDYCVRDLRVHDLCNFINKVEKEYAFDIDLTINILREYSKINSLSKSEIEILYGMLYFPQDFYSIANAYYSKQKNWDEQTFVRRITRKAGYREERKEFLDMFKEKLI